MENVAIHASNLTPYPREIKRLMEDDFHQLMHMVQNDLSKRTSLSIGGRKSKTTKRRKLTHKKRRIK